MNNIQQMLVVSLLIPLCKAMPFFLTIYVGFAIGVSTESDHAFMVLSIVAIACAIMNGIADTSAIPVVHQAKRLGCERSISYRYLRGMIARSLPLTLILAPTLAYFYDAQNTVLLLSILPILFSISSSAFNILITRNQHVGCILPPILAAMVATSIDHIFQRDLQRIATLMLVFEATRALLYYVFLQRSLAKLKDAHPPEQQLLKKAWKTGYVLVFGSAAAATMPTLSIHFADTTGAGMATLMEYTNKIWSASTLAFSGYLTHQFNKISAHHGSLTLKIIDRLSITAFLLSIPTTVLLYTLLWYATSTYGVGTLTTSSKQTLLTLAGILFCSVPIYVAGMIYVKTINSHFNTWPLTQTAIVALALHTIASASLVSKLGVSGICYSLAITQVASTYMLRKSLIRSPIFSSKSRQ